jgi:hypothetical protein
MDDEINKPPKRVKENFSVIFGAEKRKAYGFWVFLLAPP